MSRAERRAYKRMTKNQDPYALPGNAGQRTRLDRQRARRERRRKPDEFRFMSGRFLIWAIGGAFVTGLLGLSFAWPDMPFALYVGLAVAAVWLALAWLLRWAQARRAAST